MPLAAVVTAVCLLLCSFTAFADELRLQELIDETLKNSPEILASRARASASEYRIPQVQSLPDPMFMFGYQNDGFGSYTLGKSPDSQWMFSASQMFLFPGKRSLKGEMATRDAESLSANSDHIRLKTVEKVRELFYDLLFTYKSIDLIKEKASLFSKIEDAALSRYSSGIATQQEVLMAQTEKFMLLEKEEMLRQRIQSAEAMLNITVGRNVDAPLGRPVEPTPTPYDRTLQDILKMHVEHSPLIKSRGKMVAAAEAKVQMAKREYYPDFTINATYFKRGGEFDNMWSLTTTVNIPLFYKTKQRQAVLEAEASLAEARHELDSARLMISSGIRDNYSMMKAAERLMDLYRNVLVPKTYQDFESALTGYATGKVEAITVITRLKSLIDLEILYWNQFAEREKAMARIEALTGMADRGEGDKDK